MISTVYIISHLACFVYNEYVTKANISVMSLIADYFLLQLARKYGRINAADYIEEKENPLCMKELFVTTGYGNF